MLENVPTDTRKVGFLPRAMAEHMVMASAAAVASSRSEALESCMPVRSATIVWKFSWDSSLQEEGGKGISQSQICLLITECLSFVKFVELD